MANGLENYLPTNLLVGWNLTIKLVNMPAKFLESKTINLIYNCPPIGYFACDQESPKPIVWDNCREQFLGKMSSNMSGFYFSHHDFKSENVANFIAKFEEVICMSGTTMQYSYFRRTDKINIIWIIPSNFWLDCILKRSLLTLLLRCSLNFDMKNENFEDCLFGDYSECRLAKETKNAIIRFMFGFTKYQGFLPQVFMNGSSTLIRHGWHSEFVGADLSVIKNKLILPDCKKIINNFGFSFLWN
jgi:hypothetical protein